MVTMDTMEDGLVEDGLVEDGLALDGPTQGETNTTTVSVDFVLFTYVPRDENALRA